MGQPPPVSEGAQFVDADPLLKLERAVGLLDRGLLSVREYELLKRHILTDLPSTKLGEEVDEADGEAGAAAAGGSAAGDGASLAHCGSARAAPYAVRSRRCAKTLRSHDCGCLCGRSALSSAAMMWWAHDDLFSMHVLEHLDMESVLRCREVCSRWKRAVSAACLDPPLESGGLRLLRAALRREGELWADEEHARLFRMLANDLEQQHGLNARMRQILVDWLLELHWNTFVTYLEHSSLVQLVVQLVDRFIARKQVQRSNFQAVGAVAFGMVCAASQYADLALTDRHCAIAQTLYPGNDLRVTKEYLIYMCANAFTQREFEKIENDMMCFLRDAPVIPTVSQSKDGAWGCAYGSTQLCDSCLGVGAYVVKAHPRPTDFLFFFLSFSSVKAAGFEALSSLSGTTGYTLTRIVVFFLDVILVTPRPIAQSL